MAADIMASKCRVQNQCVISRWLTSSFYILSTVTLLIKHVRSLSGLINEANVVAKSLEI